MVIQTGELGLRLCGIITATADFVEQGPGGLGKLRGYAEKFASFFVWVL
jgi:hypothetical protein